MPRLLATVGRPMQVAVRDANRVTVQDAAALADGGYVLSTYARSRDGDIDHPAVQAFGRNGLPIGKPVLLG